jgi:hypothetical protein
MQQTTSGLKTWYKYGIAGVLLGTPLGLYGYDRYRCKQIHDTYLSMAKKYGQVPLHVDQATTKLACIAEGRDREQLEALKAEFMTLVQPLLTAAGIEYEWIDASRKQHAREYANLLKAKSSTVDSVLDATNSIQGANNNPILVDEQKVMLEQFPSGVITLNRIYAWLDQNCTDIRTATTWGNLSVVTPVSFFSYIWSWVWPFSKVQNLEKDPTSMDVIKGDSTDILENNVIKTLTTPSRLPAYQFHQGLLSFDQNTFSNVLHGIRKSFIANSSDMHMLFHSVPIRLGYVPLLGSGDSQSFIQRWFNRRSLVKSVADMTLSIISEHTIQWNSSLEQRYSPIVQTLNVDDSPLYGHLLVFQPLSDSEGFQKR